MKLNVSIVKIYKDKFRRAAETRLLNYYSADLVKKIIAKSSTPFLSLLFYNNGKLIDENIVQKCLDVDADRMAMFTGPDLVMEQFGVEPRIVNDSPSRDLEKIFQDTMKHIRDVWPDLHDLVSVAIERMAYPPNTEIYESASDPKYYGCIQYTMDSDSILKWAEIIAHETAHHYLFVLTANSKYSQAYDWRAEALSSIRSEIRPMIGILHGVVAETFIIQYLKRLPDDFIERNLSEYNRSWNRFSKNLIEDYKELSKFGVDFPTEDIRLLVEDSLNYVQTR